MSESQSTNISAARKAVIKENKRRDYQKHKAARLAQCKAYRQQNAEYIKARRKRWREENKELVSQRRKEHAHRHRERKNKRDKAYREERKEAIKESRKKARQKPEHKKTRRAYTQRRLKEDPCFALACAIRWRLNKAIRHKHKRGSAVADLGCTAEEAVAHIEAQFEPGMTWQNRGLHTWHIDHIKPLASFDLEDRQQFLAACHYTNLRPRWAKDNIRDGAKIRNQKQTAAQVQTGS